MKRIYLFKPSFYVHVLSSLLLLTIFVVIVKHYNRIIILDTYKLLILLLLLSITTGIHSLSHLALEKEYDFNPLTL